MPITEDQPELVRHVSIKDDSELYESLVALSERHPREGFWKWYFRMRNQGKKVNHKRLHRIYKKAGLSLRRKSKKRKITRVKEPLDIPVAFTHSWSVDFMTDALENGRKIRTFNVIDDFNREVLHIEADYSIKSSRVVWILKYLSNRYGRPEKNVLKMRSVQVRSVNNFAKKEIFFQYQKIWTAEYLNTY